MKTARALVSSILFVTILVSCAAPSSTPAPIQTTNTSIPSPAPPSPTPFPSAHVKDYTQLFAGPGNFDYSQLGWLPPSSQVDLLGTFGDFIKVDALLDGKSVTGYLHNTSLDALPASLPQLQAGDVPLVVMDTTVNFFDSASYHGTQFSGQDILLDNQDGGLYVPPQRFDLVPGFTLSFKLTTDPVDKPGSLRLTDNPDNPAGVPYWKGIRRMDLRVDSNGDVWSMELRDGLAEDHDHGFSLNVPGDVPLGLRFEDVAGKVITVFDKDSGRIYKKIDATAFTSVSFPNGFFPDGHVYLSARPDPQSHMTISGLSATKPATGAWVNLGGRLPILPLAQKQGIILGNVMDNFTMMNPHEVEIVRSNFDRVETGDLLSFWLGPDSYNYTEPDQEVNWAIANGFQVISSPVIWGNPPNIPDWLLNSHLTRQEYIDIMQKLIRMLMTHFKGRIQQWTILNEIVNRMCDPKYDFWCTHVGPDYGEIALRTAREVDPNAILIWSEAFNECPVTSQKKYMVDTEYKMLQDFKSRGVPVDVVAMQMHMFVGQDVRPIPPSKQCVIDTMRKFASLGVSVYVSEMDVNLNEVTGTQQQRLQFEAQLYHDMLAACLESGVCKSFSVWGPSDATTWLDCLDWWCYRYPKADPLLFDKNYQPKPAYQALYDALTGN